MTEFNPPISERTMEELIEMVYVTKEQWEDEAINQAKEELKNRKISLGEQKIVVENINAEIEYISKLEAAKLEENKTESYKIWQMILLFLFGPILFIQPYLYGFKTLFALRRENYTLKFKQKIIIYILSFLAWYIYGDYTFKQSEKKRLEEIEKVDSSAWEKKYGYDK